MVKPYQSIVYAIPQEQWDTMINLLGNNLTLIPDLSTEEDLTRHINHIIRAEQNTLNNVTATVDTAEGRMTEALTALTSQVGSFQEQNSTTQAEQTVSLHSQYRQMQSELWKTLKWFLIGQAVFLVTALGLLIKFLR